MKKEEMSTDVLRVFVQHYAAEVPIRTFLTLKNTCSAIANACRAQEPACHWRRFEQHMADYVSDWPVIRNYVRESPDVIVSYNDELPFSTVVIMNCTLMLEGRCRMILYVNNMHKYVEIYKDTLYVTALDNAMRLTHDCLTFRRLQRDAALCHDSNTEGKLDVFIDDVIKYREHIRWAEVGVSRSDVVPPYQALKAVLHHDSVNSHINRAQIPINDFLFFAGLDNSKK